MIKQFSITTDASQEYIHMNELLHNVLSIYSHTSQYSRYCFHKEQTSVDLEFVYFLRTNQFHSKPFMHSSYSSATQQNLHIFYTSLHISTSSRTSDLKTSNRSLSRHDIVMHINVDRSDSYICKKFLSPKKYGIIEKDRSYLILSQFARICIKIQSIKKNVKPLILLEFVLNVSKFI